MSIKDFFRRKKVQEPAPANVSEHEYHIKHRIPGVGDTSVPYVCPEHMKYLFENIESMANQMLDGLDADVQNECYMDQEIMNYQRRGDQELERQRPEHHRAIISIEEEQRTSLYQLEGQIDSITQRYEQNKKELEAYGK